MKNSMKKLRKVLHRLMEREKYVSLDRRPLDPHPLEGFIVGVSDALVLLHVVDGHTLTFNGYTAVRLKDLQAVATPRSFIPRALKLLGRTPVRPEGLDLTKWATLLASAHEAYPLVWLACERRRPGCGYVGRVRKLTQNRVHLREVDPRGRWVGTERFRFADTTLLTLGDGYVDGLIAVLTHEVGSTNLTGSPWCPFGSVRASGNAGIQRERAKVAEGHFEEGPSHHHLT